MPTTAIYCYCHFSASGGRTGTSVLPPWGIVPQQCPRILLTFCISVKSSRLQCLQHSCLHHSHLQHIFPSCLGKKSDATNRPTDSHIKLSKLTHHRLCRHIPSNSTHHNEASRLKRLLELIPWQVGNHSEDWKKDALFMCLWKRCSNLLACNVPN